MKNKLLPAHSPHEQYIPATAFGRRSAPEHAHRFDVTLRFSGNGSWAPPSSWEEYKFVIICTVITSHLVVDCIESVRRLPPMNGAIQESLLNSIREGIGQMTHWRVGQVTRDLILEPS